MKKLLSPRKSISYFSFLVFGVIFGFSIHEIQDAKSGYAAAEANKYLTASTNAYPEQLAIIHHRGHCLTYDTRNRNAFWVCQDLTQGSGHVERDGFQFKEDPAIPELFRATLGDFKGSGFDRGHLCPAGDCNSPETMSDSFYLSNVSPQNAEFNRGYWKEFEKYVRNLTNSYSHVRVFTGPLYLPYNDVNGNRYVKYQVIGPNDVAVPTHFFKVISMKNASGDVCTQAYILPNEKISPEIPLEKFKTTVNKIEKLAGVMFPINQKGKQ